MADVKLPEGFKTALERIPSKLPFESKIDNLLDKAANKINRLRATRTLSEIHSNLPYLPEVKIGTPFGQIGLPEVSLPEPRAPEIDERRKEAIKAAAAVDLSFIVALIPAVGDVIADVIEDTYAVKIRNVLKADELDDYMKYDKLGPSTLAMLRTFIRKGAK